MLRPGGQLLLADHIAARSAPIRGMRRMIELASIPLGGEHFRRHPARLLPAAGLLIDRRERFGPNGIVERLTAHKPGWANITAGCLAALRPAGLFDRVVVS